MGQTHNSYSRRLRPGPRDLELLPYVADQYAVDVAQLARLMGRAHQTARSLGRRWQQLGWARVETLVARQPALVWLTAAGLRACGLSYRRWQPSPGVVSHITAVTEVRMFIQARRPEAVWLSERQLAHDQPRLGHRPDAVVLAEGREIPVEVELTPKTPTRLLEIATELVSRYGFVWYFASNSARPCLDRVCQGFADDVIQVLDLPNAR